MTTRSQQSENKTWIDVVNFTYFIPGKTLDVNKQSHQLRDSQRRMSIIQLDRYLCKHMHIYIYTGWARNVCNSGQCWGVFKYYLYLNIKLG